MRIIKEFTLRTEYDTPEEMIKEIELLKFVVGLMFRFYNKPTKMELIGTLERLGGDFKGMADYLRQFDEQKDAAETVFNHQRNY